MDAESEPLVNDEGKPKVKPVVKQVNVSKLRIDERIAAAKRRREAMNKENSMSIKKKQKISHTSRNSFDLQASLQKKPTWRMKTGKLANATTTNKNADSKRKRSFGVSLKNNTPLPRWN